MTKLAAMRAAEKYIRAALTKSVAGGPK
jgi:hypothetical protein